MSTYKHALTLLQNADGPLLVTGKTTLIHHGITYTILTHTTVEHAL